MPALKPLCDQLFSTVWRHDGMTNFARLANFGFTVSEVRAPAPAYKQLQGIAQLLNSATKKWTENRKPINNVWAQPRKAWCLRLVMCRCVPCSLSSSVQPHQKYLSSPLVSRLPNPTQGLGIPCKGENKRSGYSSLEKWKWTLSGSFHVQDIQSPNWVETQAVLQIRDKIPTLSSLSSLFCLSRLLVIWWRCSRPLDSLALRSSLGKGWTLFLAITLPGTPGQRCPPDPSTRTPYQRWSRLATVSPQTPAGVWSKSPLLPKLGKFKMRRKSIATTNLF